jgi:hypothetical protein
MKPQTPEVLEKEGKELASEGMMFIGDKGIILGGFRNEKPVLLPDSLMKQYGSDANDKEDKPNRSDDVWIDAFRENKQSPGSFLNATAVSETINLGAVALRAGKKVIYDADKMEITNIPEANKFLRRDYRKGWELV